MNEKDRFIQEILMPHLEMFKSVDSSDKNHDWIVDNIIEDIRRLIRIAPDNEDIRVAERIIKTYDNNKNEVIDCLEDLTHPYEDYKNKTIKF